MSSNKVLHPEVLWAQRNNELYITINVTDCKDPKINVTENKISFEGRSGPEPQALYGFELDFHKEVKPETAKRSTTARNIFLVIEKAEQKGYWPRLQKDKTKIPFLKTDFAKWKDEDDEEEEGGPDPLGGMDFSNLMGGDADSALDDSDEEMPSLEETADDGVKTNDETKVESAETEENKSEDIKNEEESK